MAAEATGEEGKGGEGGKDGDGNGEKKRRRKKFIRSKQLLKIALRTFGNSP